MVATGVGDAVVASDAVAFRAGSFLVRSTVLAVAAAPIPWAAPAAERVATCPFSDVPRPPGSSPTAPTLSAVFAVACPKPSVAPSAARLLGAAELGAAASGDARSPEAGGLSRGS
jgi:hypothetical protein